MAFVSEFHRHSEACKVPLSDVCGPLPTNPKDRSIYRYYYQTAPDGSLFCEYDGMHATEGCNHDYGPSASRTGMPIFTWLRP